jgi:hypothetical protein
MHLIVTMLHDCFIKKMFSKIYETIYLMECVDEVVNSWAVEID